MNWMWVYIFVFPSLHMENVAVQCNCSSDNGVLILLVRTSEFPEELIIDKQLSKQLRGRLTIEVPCNMHITPSN
jgi:hypothetical protein